LSRSRSRQQQQQQQQQQQHNSSSPAFESKTFQATIGLQRGDEFIVFAASAITIDGPVDDVQIKLPLSPVGMEDSMPKSKSKLQNAQGNWNIKPKYFNRDSSRKFGLAKDAFIGATISIHNATCEYDFDDDYYYYSIADVERSIINCEPSQVESIILLEPLSTCFTYYILLLRLLILISILFSID